MKSQDIMQEVNQLLDDIVTRALKINRKNASGDALLDIDLAKDDIRQLYRRLDLLRGIISERARMDSASDTLSPKKETNTPDETTPDQSTAGPQPDPPPLRDPLHTHEMTGSQNQDIPDNRPENKDKHTASDQSGIASREGTKPDHPVEGFVRPGEAEEDITRQDAEPEKPTTRSEPSSDAPLTDPPAARQQVQPPGSGEPVKGQQQEQKQAQAAPQAKAKNNNGNRAVIDILSEYSDRTIGDTYMTDKDDSLHKRISVEKEDKSIGERMQNQPIANLKDAIGVNEKFLFINELFDGDIQEYQDAIAKLNDMEDAGTAFEYLNVLGVEQSWDATRSADTIEKLAQLVHRRYL